MRTSIKIYWVVSLLTTATLTILLLIGPFLRSLASDIEVSVDVTPTSYDCAGESCIGFILIDVDAEKFSKYKGKLLLPYRLPLDRDKLNIKWAHLLGNTPQKICLKGHMHRFSVSTLTFFHPVYGGYEFKLTDYKEKNCATEN